VISAKAYVSGAVAASALCRLAADTDIDNSLGNGIQFTLTNLVVHEFAAAGAVDYQCSTGGTQTASQIKIVAIRVGNFTGLSSFGGGPSVRAGTARGRFVGGIVLPSHGFVQGRRGNPSWWCASPTPAEGVVRR
jgi:hypothetical protein